MKSMFERLERQKVFRDPIYGYVRVDYKVISELIDTKEFQRLRRILQLSGVSLVFQTAEHSRFTHSLGAYECAREVLEEVYGAKDELSEYEQVLFLATALLHDIGHGPYSHAFEHVLTVSHELMSVNIITSPITEVNKVLLKHKINPNDIKDILLHQSKYKVIESLISSQIDVDRIDYLQRDAYNTGATYGNIDRIRIFRSMLIENNKVLFRESGINSLESYIMARYHMYWQVYYHPIASCYELLFESIYKRLYELKDSNININYDIKPLIDVMTDSENVEAYLILDDWYIFGLVKQLKYSSDIVLKSLACSVEKRDLFKYMVLTEDNSSEALSIYSKYTSTEYSKYFFYQSSVSQIAYLEGANKKIGLDEILIKKNNGKIVSLEDASHIIKGLTQTAKMKSTRYYYKEFKNE